MKFLLANFLAVAAGIHTADHDYGWAVFSGLLCLVTGFAMVVDALNEEE